MLPDTFFHTIRQRIKPAWMFAFGTAFASGLLIHLYRLTNNLLNWDSVYNFHSSQNAIHLGRCFLTLTCGIGSYYDLHWINGLLSLFYLGLVCVLLVEIFQIQSKTAIFFVSVITVSFPSVASTFAYMYTADGYFLAMLLMTFGVFLTLKKKRGFLPAIFIIAFAYGSYQAYITYAIMLVLTWSVLQLLFSDRSIKELLQYWGRFLLMGAGGTIFYVVCNKILTRLEGAVTSDYNGIAQMALPNAENFLSAAKNCLIDFAYFFFGPLSDMSFYKILNIGLFVLLSIFFCFLFIQKKFWKTPGRTLLLLFCLASMPFACSLIYFISPGVRYYMLMYAAFSLIYLLPVLLLDTAGKSGNPETRQSASLPKGAGIAHNRASLLFSWSFVLLTFLTAFNFSLLSNISYLYMQTSYEKTYGLVLRMTDRIEQLPDFSSIEKLCVIGHFDGYDDIELILPPAFAGVKDSYFISEQEHFVAMMQDRFGLVLENCTEEEIKKIENSSAFQEMPCWPDTASVIQIDDTAIIKIAEE